MSNAIRLAWSLRRRAVLCGAEFIGLAVPALAVRGHAPVRSIRLLKMPHGRLHFRWTAVVSQPGGAFVLGRRSERGFDPIYQLPSGASRQSYRAEIDVQFGTSLNQLRY